MPHQCTNCGRAFADGSKEMLSGCPDCGGNKFQFHPGDTDTEPDPDAEPPDPPEPNSSVARTVGNAAATVRDLVGGSPDRTGPEPGASASAGAGAGTGSGAGTATPEDDSLKSHDSTGNGGHGSPTGSARPETETPTATEDSAQASARSEMVDPRDIMTDNDGWEPTQDTQAGVADSPAASGQPSVESEQVDASSASPAQDESDSTADDRPDLQELREELNDQFESIKVRSPGQYELNLMELYDREEYIIALQEDGRYTIQVPENWSE